MAYHRYIKKYRNYKTGFNDDRDEAVAVFILLIIGYLVYKYRQTFLMILFAILSLAVIYLIYRILKHYRYGGNVSPSEIRATNYIEESIETAGVRDKLCHDAYLNSSAVAHQEQNTSANPEPPIQNSRTGARVINQSGALRDLLDKIGVNKINSLQNIEDVRNNHERWLRGIVDEGRKQANNTIKDAEDSFDKLQQAVADKRLVVKDDIQKEIEKMNKFINPLNDDAPLYFRFFYRLVSNKYKKKKERLENETETEIDYRLRDLVDKYNKTADQLDYYKNHFNDLVEQNTRSEIALLERIVSTIKENEFLYFGAIGEDKVIEELRKLPSNFCVFNDYRRRFDPPKYNKRENDRIFSIQVDHLVIGPTGLFIIETKNWSIRSIENPDLYSPVKQVKRSNYALFVTLNKRISNGSFHSFRNHWGDVKISPKNVVVPIQYVPIQTFQHAEIIPIQKLSAYITSGQYIFNDRQVEELVNYFSSTAE